MNIGMQGDKAIKSLQIEWRDPWLALLLTFHIAVTMTAVMTRNHANFQIMLFLVLCKFS